jgi:hypothetical protein
MSILSGMKNLGQVTRAKFNLNPVAPVEKALIEAAGVKTPFIVPVGSRVTCSPPPMDTDEDFLVLTDDTYATRKQLEEFGFEYDSTTYAASGSTFFISMRMGQVNYIITSNPEWYDAFLTATYICKRLNVLDKEDRIAVFDAIMLRKSFADKVEEKWTYKAARIGGDDINVSETETVDGGF